jgi:hypothetical protein
MTMRMQLGAVALASVIWACGGSETAQQQEPARDLSLAPAESVAALNDQPATTPPPAAQPAARPRPQPPRQPATQTQTQRQPAPPPAAPSLAEGTVVDIYATDTLTSRHHQKGQMVTATLPSALSDSRGREVIPAGAIFSGTISDIAPAETPGGQGRLVLTFNRVSFGGRNYAVQARQDTIGTYMKGRGVTGGEAVKVGAGAAIGAIAGRLLGGNAKGTAIGAAAGAAAGAGYAAATRDVDIILPAGALVRLVLTSEFKAEPIAD